MKEILKKHKEIIIAILIVVVVVILVGANFYRIYQKDFKISNSRTTNIVERNVNENSYYIENGKLYISYDGENVIEVPGDFSDKNEFDDGTYQISEYKTIFFYNSNNKTYLVYSDDSGKNWNTVELTKNGSIKYLEFFNKDVGIMYEIEDVAMTVAFGSICKTSDGGNTWENVSDGIDDIFKTDSEVKFFDQYLGFITMPNNGGNSCELYNTQDGGKTFSKVEVKYIELEDTDLEWNEIYDYYYIPVKEYSTYYLKIGQGADGDYKGGNSIEYISYTGSDWSTNELQKNSLEKMHEEFDKRVANRSDEIFLKDFENYNPESSEIKISQSKAEKIADIGFEEAGIIGESGEKESQIMTMEEVIANNFFTMNHNCINEIYTNVKRKCYVFTREDDMGNGSKVYIDVTTGLIIGGQCFRD